MHKYALLDNRLYTAVASPTDFTKGCPADVALSRVSWNDQYEAAPTGSSSYLVRGIQSTDFGDRWSDNYHENLVMSNVVVNTLSPDGNLTHIEELKDAIEDLKLTEEFAINSAIRVEVRYCILDDNQEVIDEETAKIKVGTIEDFVQPLPIGFDNKLEYKISQAINARIELAAPFRELGISKGSRGATRIVRILNIRAYISKTNQNVYSQFLTEAQSKIGWPVNSITQEQIRSSDVLIYDMLDDPDMLRQLPRDITIRDRKDRVDLNFTLYTDLFAYTCDSNDIDECLFMNQRMQSKYSVITKVPSTAHVVDNPTIENVSYGETVSIFVEADDGYRINSIEIKGKFPYHDFDTIELEPGEVAIQKTCFEVSCNGNRAVILFYAMDDNYVVTIGTTTVPVENPVVPSEPVEPEPGDTPEVVDPVPDGGSDSDNTEQLPDSGEDTPPADTTDPVPDDGSDTDDVEPTPDPDGDENTTTDSGDSSGENDDTIVDDEQANTDEI